MRLVDCSLVRFLDLLKNHLFRNFGARGVENKAGYSNYLGHSVPLIRGEFSKVDYGIKKEKSANLRPRDAQPA